MLWASAALAAAGIVLVVLGGHVVVVGLGILVWGLGASLGFPVGMSAAADDPARSASPGLGRRPRSATAPSWADRRCWAGSADRVGTLEAMSA